LSKVQEAQWKLDEAGAVADLKSEIKYALAAMRECFTDAQQIVEGRRFERAS
jgi:hypothetical protein